MSDTTESWIGAIIFVLNILKLSKDVFWLNFKWLVKSIIHQFETKLSYTQQNNFQRARLDFENPFSASPTYNLRLINVFIIELNTVVTIDFKEIGV